MKNFLFSLVFLGASYSSLSQLRINEMYVMPVNGETNTEFFELANDPNETYPENADSYALVSYFNDGTEMGAYVFDMPNRNVGPGGFLFAAAGPRLSKYQNTKSFTSTPHFNWNLTPTAASSSSAKKFVYNNGAWDAGTSIAGLNVNNVFNKTIPMGGSSDLVVLLFKKDGSNMDLVDGFIASEAEDRFETPDYIQDLEDLPFTLRVGGIDHQMEIDFDELGNYELGAVPAADFASEDGYYFCSSWDQTMEGQFMTPNLTNTGLQGNPLQAVTNCLVSDNFVTVQEVSGQVSPYPVTASLYLDNDKDRVLDLHNGDTKYSQIVIRTQGRTYSMLKPVGANNFILVLDGQGKCFDDVIPFFCEPEIVTPVTLASFQAQRRGSSVLLDWKTESESDNKGFSIERRKAGSDRWETVGFVATQAPGGTSDRALTYSYSDANDARGITQYRLLQTDNGGRNKYSSVVSVRGMDQSGTVTIYPNPSQTGSVNIVFDDATALRNVVVTDMVGRIVQQWRGISSNSLQVRNLKTGLYNVRIQNVQTGAEIIERLAVTK